VFSLLQGFQMRFFVAMFTATSTAEMTALASEPVSMLLWGMTLLALCTMLQRANTRSAETASVRVEPSDSRSMDAVPSFAARS
jgi:hypothetical protein